MIYYVILGYGCNLTDKIKKYLNHVCLYVRRYDNVIVSGGYTSNKTAPDISEAMMMEEYLRKYFFLKNIIKEDGSITTLDNLINSKKIISERSEMSQVIIFYSSSRLLKVWMMSLFIFGIPMPKIISYDFGESWFEKMKQTFIATPLDLLAMVIPFFRKLQRERKLRIINTS